MTLSEMVDSLANMMVILKKVQSLDPALMSDAFVDEYAKFMEVTQFLSAVFASILPGTIDQKEEAIREVLEHVEEQSITLLQLYETQRILKGLE